MMWLVSPLVLIILQEKHEVDLKEAQKNVDGLKNEIVTLNKNIEKKHVCSCLTICGDEFLFLYVPCAG